MGVAGFRVNVQITSAMRLAQGSHQGYPPNFSSDITMEYVHVGALLLGIGAWLTYWKRKRAFNRTNEYGVQRYPSYWRKLLSLSKDTLIGVSAFILLSAGTLLVAFQYQDTWGGIILLPVYLYMLYLLL